VNRLVRSGVVVVAAAGNTGHVSTMVNVGGAVKGASEAGQPMTINDPGNADLAITVGSTDREKPHLYGISYFSSKGPTGDGRCKPDVVAPGEQIISSAAGAYLAKVPPAVLGGNAFGYVEDSGTSMAAPHVSGVIAGFLSIRREFIGQATTVRDLVTASATDLKRDKALQGAGLVDLMRLIQSV
jgi:subtilisin family serine protease